MHLFTLSVLFRFASNQETVISKFGDFFSSRLSVLNHIRCFFVLIVRNITRLLKGQTFLFNAVNKMKNVFIRIK